MTITNLAPRKMKPTVPDVRRMAEAYYAKDGNACGGALHIVLDDGNVDDDDVQFCLATAREQHDQDGVTLAEQFLQMSRTQRKKVYTTRSRRV